MPFLDRLEMVAVSGRSRGAVYEAVRKLESGGLVASVPHAAQLIPSTRRYFLTAAGLHRLAREEGMTVDELLARCPVSEQGRRVLMERLDAAAVVYRLASALSNVAFPIRFRWYRAMPMDAAIALPDGRTVAVVRQGLTADRTAFSKRLWRLREKFRPSAVLLLMPDEVRLRHARRLMAGAPSIAFLALESEAASAGAGAPIWRPPSGPALLDLRTALSYARLSGAWPAEEQPSKVFLPGEISLEEPEHETPGWMLPALLKPAEKRAVDLLSDWPWIAPAHLGELLGVKRSMLSRILVRLPEAGPRGRSPRRGRPTPCPRQPGAGYAGTARPILGWRGEEAVERDTRRRESPCGLAQRLRQEKPPTAQERRAHRRGALVRRGPREAGPLPLQAGRTTRPAPPGIEILPARRPAALHSARCLLRPPQRRKDMALLPGVGTPSRAPRDDGRTHRPIHPLLLLASPHRRPRCAALGVGRVRGRDRTDTLPARSERRDGANRGHCAPVRLPQEPAGESGAPGKNLAHDGRPGTGLRLLRRLNGNT